MGPIVFPRMRNNLHLQAILQRFGSVTVRPEDIPAHANIVCICFTNRSGSHYLAEALQSSGRLNLAGELLNGDAVCDDASLHGHLRFADYFASQMRWRMIGHRFAIKLAIGHLEILGHAGVLDHCRHTAHFVFLRRHDLLGQAISYEIARQTGQWTSQTTVATPLSDLAFARQRIAAAMQAFADENRQFERFFADNGIVPTHVQYEQLIADPNAAVGAIGRAIGLPDLAAVPASIGVQRQAGPINDRLRAWYLQGR